MASSINGVPLFDHIRYMFFTTVPSIIITLVLFTVLGFTHSGTDAGDIAIYTDTLNAKFNISPWLLAVPLVTAVLIARKLPALIVLGLSVAVAAVFAVLFQPELIKSIGSTAAISHGITGSVSDAKLMLAGVIDTIYDTVRVDTGVEAVDELVTSRGMLGMLNTVYLIICAMCFGGCLKASGMLRHIASLLIPLARKRTGMVVSTVFTGTAPNGLVSDQYLSIILTSNIYKDIYARQGYESRLLSRSVEDSATVTSPLFPWSSCGMTQATILGIPTLVYLPYCFFNIISPLMSMLIAALGYKIVRCKES
jgi:NhaC family Na+:H+ antiporter